MVELPFIQMGDLFAAFSFWHIGSSNHISQLNDETVSEMKVSLRASMS
ncbi:hypothetical protein NSTCB13_06990 [Nostoc sp. DSM 114160]